MKKIITHPDNVTLLRQALREAAEAKPLPELYWDMLSSIPDRLLGFEIVANSHLDRERWTGRYILPDGRTVLPEEVRVADGPFFEWGGSPLEITWLLEWGLIEQEMELLFYEMADWSLRMTLEPTIKVPFCGVVASVTF